MVTRPPTAGSQNNIKLSRDGHMRRPPSLMILLPPPLTRHYCTFNAHMDKNKRLKAKHGLAQKVT